MSIIAKGRRLIKSFSGKRMKRAEELAEKVHNVPFKKKQRLHELLEREGKLKRIAKDIKRRRRVGTGVGTAGVGGYTLGEIDKPKTGEYKMNNYELIKKASTMVASSSSSPVSIKKRKEPTREELISFIKRKTEQNKKDDNRLFNRNTECCPVSEDKDKELSSYSKNILQAIARHLNKTYYRLEVE
jgi:hypothetical protein